MAAKGTMAVVATLFTVVALAAAPAAAAAATASCDAAGPANACLAPSGRSSSSSRSAVAEEGPRSGGALLQAGRKVASASEEEVAAWVRRTGREPSFEDIEAIHEARERYAALQKEVRELRAMTAERADQVETPRKRLGGATHHGKPQSAHHGKARSAAARRHQGSGKMNATHQRYSALEQESRELRAKLGGGKAGEIEFERDERGAQSLEALRRRLKLAEQREKALLAEKHRFQEARASRDTGESTEEDDDEAWLHEQVDQQGVSIEDSEKEEAQDAEAEGEEEAQEDGAAVDASDDAKASRARSAQASTPQKPGKNRLKRLFRLERKVAKLRKRMAAMQGEVEGTGEGTSSESHKSSLGFESQDREDSPERALNSVEADVASLQNVLSALESRDD